MPFVRVRGAGKNDPPHEFDVRVEQYNRYPERYGLIDGDPVEVSRPATFPEPVKPAPRAKPKRPARSKPQAPKAPKPIAAEAAEAKENQ